MGELETDDTLEHFVNSVRAGRRNALPELQIEINDPEAAKLAERLSDMTSRCDDEPSTSEKPSTSKQAQTASS